MKELFSLGDLYVSDFIGDGEHPRGKRTELTLVMDEDIGAPKLTKQADLDTMYGEYWYRSGINLTMTNHLKSIAEELPQLIPSGPGDVWVDIGCNDGTLLKFVDNNFKKIGVDPADDSYTAESRQIADHVIQNYFTAETYQKEVGEPAKIITAIAMFYDLEDPLKFLQDIDMVLHDEGLLVIQMSYTPLMIKQLAFDNICHEHVYYHSLTSMKRLLDKVGMTIVDCQLNDINGGSYRLYIRKQIAKPEFFKTSPYRDVAQMRVDSLQQMEDKMGITDPKIYLDFYEKICNLRDETVQFIKQAKADGKNIWGYGASTKGNTLLQWFGLDETMIDGIAERSPYKFGLRTVGTNIPIYSEDEMRKANPDYLLILPWHFIHEFKSRENDYLNNGGHFIVTCPKFEVI